MLAAAPSLGLIQLLAQTAPSGRLTNPQIRQQHGQQHQVGEYQHSHPDTRGNGQITDDLNLDHHQHGKAHGIGQ
ncbi:hypothetical protein D3C87_2037240 [compost metagenome]